jgi:hypothetical protein
VTQHNERDRGRLELNTSAEAAASNHDAPSCVSVVLPNYIYPNEYPGQRFSEPPPERGGMTGCGTGRR